MQVYIEQHSGEMLVLLLSMMVLATLLILVPQLLRANSRAREFQHTENMRALEQGKNLVPPDERSRAAGRTAYLVPIVALITASTVTCSLASFKAEYVFSVSLAVWSVAGVIGLAAITGGVALMGRLAQVLADENYEEEEEEAGGS